MFFKTFRLNSRSILIVTADVVDSVCEAARLGEGEGGLLISDTSDVDNRIRFAPFTDVDGAGLK